MQHTLNINLPEVFHSTYNANPKTAVLEVLNSHLEPLELLLQGYHSREKVRQVNLEADSLELDGTGKGTITVSYQIEEFNVCAAIDRTDMERMKLTFSISEATGMMKVAGIALPEREPDTF
ncbi:hypothetical protein [Pedobacter gandavensis]|uniref:hypothetical protein n=1 Tax=Pedobacter gandavensis TaxID=2679963 RepID=UPI00292FC440|nr:hypothetical protein [Pedobacter gandavensis]